MKKKIIFGILIILIVGICGGLIMKTNGYFDKYTVEKKNGIIKLSEGLVKKDYNSLEKTKLLDITTIEEIADKYFKKFNFESENKEKNIEYYDNIVESKKEVRISNGKAIVELDAESGNLISIMNNNNNLPQNNLSEVEINNIAYDLLEQIKEGNGEYKLLYIEEFDSEIWRAGFEKKYDGLSNVGEQIKFSFSPMTKEIKTLVIKNIEYANNEIKISLEEAQRIAEKYLDKSVANNMEMYIDIVMPNGFFLTEIEYDEIMIKPTETRKAYVCKFDNKGETTIYIDCTTGEVLGGDLLEGEEF